VSSTVFADRVCEEGNKFGRIRPSVRPSVRPFVFTLTFEQPEY